MTPKRSGLVAPNDPILLRTAHPVPVNEITGEPTQQTTENLLNIAYGEQKDRSRPILVGLAAPQAGISKRIILVDVGADGHGAVSELQVFINPKIIWKSDDLIEWYEGCYSTDRVCGIVERPDSVQIQAYTPKGQEIVEKYFGYVARIFQHEIDHLDGKEFTTHITDDDKLHWVEEHEFPEYRDHEAWRNWPHKCPRARWEKIKGIR